MAATRICTVCAVALAPRSRWCGRCGAPVSAAGPRGLALRCRGAGRSARAGRERVVVASVLVAALVGLVVGPWAVLGGGTDGPSGGADEVELPDADALRGDAAGLQRALPVGTGAGVRCLDGSACLAWSHPVATTDPSLVGVAVGVASVAVATAGELALVDAWTGEPRWVQQVELAQPPSVALADGVVVASGARGGLLLLAAEDGRAITARETPAATPGAGPITQARRYDGRVAAVRASDATDQQLVVVDLATGTSTSVSRRADQVALARSGPVLHLGAGRLEGRDAVLVSTRWTSTLPFEPVELLAFGDTVVARGVAQLEVLSATTGAPVPGARFGPDEGFVTVTRQGEGLLAVAPATAQYVDRSGATWRTSVPDGCCRGMALTEETVTVLLDDGEARTFARADGTPHEPRADDPPAPPAASLLDGGLLLQPRADAGWLVADRRTAEPLAETDGTVVGSTRDGALVVVTGGGVAAIARPASAEPPRRYGFARRCSSGAPGGCGFGG